MDGNSVTLRASGIRDVTFGSRVVIVEPVNLYQCTIGDDCFIGPFVEIQRNVRIGHHSKVQSHSFICELVSIGDYCVIAHGVMFINDLYKTGRPAGGKKELWKETLVGDHVLIGSNATILPVRICDRTVIGAGAVVTRNITSPGIYAGNPARKLKDL